MGSHISKDYAGKSLLVLGVLNGAFIFTADLVRAIDGASVQLQIDFIRASSYGSASESSGSVKVLPISDPAQWRDTHVLLVDEIIDSGATLHRIANLLRAEGAASVRVAALLDKKARRRIDFVPDYCGFDCPDAFVVGYGLDYNEHFRNLPYVAALKPEAYS